MEKTEINDSIEMNYKIKQKFKKQYHAESNDDKHMLNYDIFLIRPVINV